MHNYFFPWYIHFIYNLLSISKPLLQNRRKKKKVCIYFLTEDAMRMTNQDAVQKA